MMMPSSVRNVLNLFDQRELMAIETDSLRLILAIFRINILHYMIRKDKAKVHRGQVLFFAFAPTNAIYTNALHRELHRRRPRSFYKWAGGAWQPCAEDRRYLCRIYPYREIFMRLIEIFETSKKQDLTPPCEIKFIDCSFQ